MSRLVPLLALFLAAAAVGAQGREWGAPFRAQSSSALAAALSAPGATGSEIEVSVPLELSEDLTVPKGVRLKVAQGGFLALAPGKKLTILGSFSCDRVPCFRPGDRVSFGTGAVSAIYPEWFGAQGDAASDDSAALNAALQAAPSGATLKGEGRYSVTQLEIDRPLTLSGLTLLARNPGHAVAKQDVIKVSASDVTIERCQVTLRPGELSNVADASGLYADRVNNLRVIDSSFDGGKNRSVAKTPYGALSVHNSTRVLVQGGRVVNAQYEGLLLLSCRDSQVSKLYAANCGNSGIATAHGSRNLIRDCQVDSCNASNITLNCTESTVTGCLSKNAGTWGINLGHSHAPAHGSRCLGNTIEGASRLATGNWGGIQMQSSSRVTIADNVIAPCADHSAATPPRYNSGIVVANLPLSCKIANNVISAQPGHGIRVYDAGSAVQLEIDGNRVSDSLLTGIYVYGGASLVISGNSIVKSNRAGLAHQSGIWVDGVSGTHTVEVVRNRIRDDGLARQNYGVRVLAPSEATEVKVVDNSIKGWTQKQLLLPKKAVTYNNSTQ